MSGPGEPPLSAALDAPPLPPPILEAQALIDDGLDAQLGPAPRVLEVGFGRGELLLAMAAQHPGQRYLGVEISRKRVEKMGKRIEKARLANVRLICAPGQFLLERVLPEAVFAACWVHCPDPWPKKRHHRRRFFQPETVERVARILEPGAILHASTDHEEYALQIADVLAASPSLENLHAPAPWSRERPSERPATGYETDWLAEGRTLAYFRYRRK